MRHVGATVLIWIAVSASASARDIYVNNVAGDDRFSGVAAATQGARIGPCRTIAHALELAAKGDRIILAATGEPYRESITLQAGRHSGFGDRPFEIVGGAPRCWAQRRCRTPLGNTSVAKCSALLRRGRVRSCCFWTASRRTACRSAPPS